MTQEIVDRHWPLCRCERVGGLPARIGARHRDLEFGKLGQVDADGIPQAQTPVLDKQHRRHRRERLGHRVEPKDRVLRHRGARLGIELPEGFEVRDGPLARHEGHSARKAAGLDLAGQRLANPREALAREADFFGTGGQKHAGTKGEEEQ